MTVTVTTDVGDVQRSNRKRTFQNAPSLTLTVGYRSTDWSINFKPFTHSDRSWLGLVMRLFSRIFHVYTAQVHLREESSSRLLSLFRINFFIPASSSARKRRMYIVDDNLLSIVTFSSFTTVMESGCELSNSSLLIFFY